MEGSGLGVKNYIKGGRKRDLNKSQILEITRKLLGYLLGLLIYATLVIR